MNPELLNGHGCLVTVETEVCEDEEGTMVARNVVPADGYAPFSEISRRTSGTDFLDPLPGCEDDGAED